MGRDYVVDASQTVGSSIAADSLVVDAVAVAVSVEQALVERRDSWLVLRRR